MRKLIISLALIFTLAFAQAQLQQCPHGINLRVMCPMYYKPICALIKCQTGLCYQTFGNSCNGCRVGIISYTDGPCPNDKEEEK
ncbi:hypothetical protein ABPG74_020744 [Tetrahymena malaccensis]